jgi:hypothetical protein
MTNERNLWVRLCVVALTAAVLVGASESMAQSQRKSPGGLTGGARQHPGTWNNQRASRSIRHASDYSRDISSYARGVDRIAPAIVKSESEELGRIIAQGQKEIAAARELAGADTDAQTAYKSIDGHLSAAAKHHAMLHEECCKDSVDGNVCAKCCNDILMELDKAKAEHDALIKSMEADHPQAG